MQPESIIQSAMNIALALVLAPLLLGIINRTKAKFAGRRGSPLLQLYFDIAKLLQKGTVYSRTGNWLVKAGPVVGLAAALAALAIVPLGGSRAALNFHGDLLLLAYFLGLMRFFTVLAAMDTGSPFEGMGASREVTFSALAEVALLVGLAALARQTRTQSLCLSDIYAGIGSVMFAGGGGALLLVAAAMLVVFLAENARIPVDDPNTHLELTMIHEAMVLDHGGPDLAMIEYGSAIKLWVIGALLVGIVAPGNGANGPVGAGWIGYMFSTALAMGGMVVLAIATGVIESTMARLRLKRVPQLLVAAGVLSALAMALSMRAQ